MDTKEYIARRANVLSYFPFIVTPEILDAVDSVTSEVQRDILLQGIEAYGVRHGAEAQYYLMLDETKKIYHEICQEIKSSQYRNFPLVEEGEIQNIEECADLFRAYIRERERYPDNEQKLPFIYKTSYAKKIRQIPERVDRENVLYEIFHYGITGKINKIRFISPESKDIFASIKLSLEKARIECLDYFQGERNDELLFEEFGPSFEKPLLESLNQFLAQINTPGYRSKFSSFFFYDRYVVAIKSLPTAEQRAELIQAILSYGTEGDRGLFQIKDITVGALFISLKASIRASQKRYKSSIIDGSKGGRPGKCSRKLVVELAKRGNPVPEDIAHILRCTVRTVLRYATRDEIYDIAMSSHNRYRKQGSRGIISTNPFKDPTVIRLLRETETKEFKNLDENNIMDSF